LIPLLGILYRVSNENSHLIYMMLIIVLILTEHSQFIENVHNVRLKTVPWKMEKAMTEVSLGGLLVLVLVRTVQTHVNQLRERYLHINCLAALANLSSKITRLNQQSSSALVNLVVLLLKRHSRIEKRIHELEKGLVHEPVSNGSTSPGSPLAISKVDAVSASIIHLDIEDLVRLTLHPGQIQALIQTTLIRGCSEILWVEEVHRGTARVCYCQKNDMILLEEVIRTLLEIINSVITHSLATNKNLLYELLHQQDRFRPLKDNVLFQDIMHNLDVVINFFTIKLDKECAINGGQVVMPEQVMQLIDKHIVILTRHQQLKKFPELRFKYVEESSPDDFFVPYVWLMIFLGASDYFDPSIVRVFKSSLEELKQTV
ncbi:hypothetical protein Ciccas_013274, partial [Cichlidogyrus casuarinus]